MFEVLNTFFVERLFLEKQRSIKIKIIPVFFQPPAVFVKESISFCFLVLLEVFKWEN